MVGIDLVGQLPSTVKENTDILLVVDLFNKHAEVHALIGEEKAAEGCASVIVNNYMPRWGCPHTLLSDRDPEFISMIIRAV